MPYSAPLNQDDNVAFVMSDVHSLHCVEPIEHPAPYNVVMHASDANAAHRPSMQRTLHLFAIINII